jgi:starch synthase
VSLRVLFVVSECVPIVKVGGLGDVAGALPAALVRRGHDVRVLLPRYRAAKRFPARQHPAPFIVPLGDGPRGTAVWEGRLDGGVPVYLLEHDWLYERDGIYGDAGGEYGDSLVRYALLARAASLMGDYLGVSFDLLHLHDWQAALAAVYVAELGGPVTVLTVHNLGYQGRFPREAYAAVGLGWERFGASGLDHWGGVNVLAGGLSRATMLSTVSPRYAHEVQTAEGGAGLDGLLRARGADLVGILNGIDERLWDPRTDPIITARYDEHALEGKAACKRALQEALGLEVRAELPLAGVVTRFAEQKGIDLVLGALDALLAGDLQIVVLGSGDRWAEDALRERAARSARLRVHVGHDEALAHHIMAAADLFLMPSRYEPCGLAQMYAQRYAALPVVRAVGGLDDTVEHEVTGFKFAAPSAAALADAVLCACAVRRERPERFAAMQRAAMREPRSWDNAAAQYEALYRMALAKRPRAP